MTVDKSGDPKFTKKTDDVEADARMKEWTAQLAAKQESALTRTAHELRQQLILGMLPYPDEPFTLEENGGGYVISMTEESSRGTIRMGRDFKIADFYDFTSRRHRDHHSAVHRDGPGVDHDRSTRRDAHEPARLGNRLPTVGVLRFWRRANSD
jgi:hypothetical protein